MIGWRPQKWLQGTIGRYKKFATEIGKSGNKNKQTDKQIEMVNRYHKRKHGMNVNGILWVHVVWMFVRKTEPVILPIMNRLDQTGSKWFTCAFQDCQVPITTSILSCLKILIFFWIPQKNTITIKYKKELSYFAYRILSENTLHFILLCSSYIIPTHRKNNNKTIAHKIRGCAAVSNTA